MLKNIKNQNFLVFLFSITYIFLEITFNIGLIDFINSKNTEIDVFQNLERLGRILASLGFSLFLVKILNYLIKGVKKWMVIVSFIVFSITFYNTQTIIFEKIIDNMSSEQKFLAYNVGVHRILFLNGQAEFSLLANKEKNYDNIINSMVILLNSESNKKKIINSNEKYFTVNYDFDHKMFENIYDKLQKIDNEKNIKEYYKVYKIESKRYENSNNLFKNKYKENFIKTIGFEPSLSEEDFIEKIKEQQQNKTGIKLKDITLVPENKNIGMKELKLGNVPPNLTKEKWVEFINNYINTAIDAVKMDQKNVDNLPYSKNIISSVVITPIAIILSLLSIVLNIGLLIGKKSMILMYSWLIIILSYAIYFNYNPYNINPLVNKIIGVENILLSATQPYRNIIHRTFVNDNNPNAFNIIRIKKPEIPTETLNSSKIEKLFKELKEKNNGMENINKNENLYIDENKINDKNYYGELNKKNPYAN